MEQLKRRIREILASEGCSCEFYFSLAGENGVYLRKLDIEEDDHKSLEALFTKSVNDSLVLDEEKSLINISDADDRAGAVYHYDIDAKPDEFGLIGEAMNSQDIQLYDFANDSLDDLSATLILIGTHESQMCLYKHHYPVTLLRGANGFFMSKLKGGNRFEQLDDDILRIDPSFHFIKIDDEYYVLDIKVLERFFGFHEAVKNLATEGIERIAAANLLVDDTVLTARLEDIPFSRKIAKSVRNSPVLGLIPNNQIIQFTRTHPALQGRFKYSEDGSKIDLKTKASQQLFLKLLNDDYLRSELTTLFYDSVAKEEVAQEDE